MTFEVSLFEVLDATVCLSVFIGTLSTDDEGDDDDK